MSKLRLTQFSVRLLLGLCLVTSLFFAVIRNVLIEHDQVVASLESRGFVVLDVPRFPGYTPKWIQTWGPREIQLVDGICHSMDDITLINECHGLRNLHISGSEINSDAFSGLGKFPQCSALSLSDTRVTDKVLKRIAQSMPNLESLWICGTGVTEEGLAILSGLPKLTSLSVDGNLLSGTGVKGLEGLRLIQLNAAGDRVDKSTVARIIEHLPIESLSFSFGCDVPDAAIDHAARSGWYLGDDCGSAGTILLKSGIPSESRSGPD